MMIRRILSVWVLVSFLLNFLGPLPQARADEPLSLPAVGSMINLTPAFEPALIKGITVNRNDPFRFNFIMDAGKSGLTGEPLKKEGDRLVKYFFACLTIPEKDLWVNLSPYEKDRIIPKALGQTPLGRDLLAQDYILKQLTASLIDPEKDLGREFWSRVYAKARQIYGTSQIPVNTFNKVWILADHATVVEQGQTAFVMDGHLKVMLEEDYLSLSKHQRQSEDMTSVVSPSTLPNELPLNVKASQGKNPSTSTLSSNIVRSIILPEIEKEVNTGKNFATLRQIYNSLILASWYKRNLKEAVLNQLYADKNTVKGVNLSDPTAKEQIYQQYLQAYKKGVFNFIKEESDPGTNEMLPRKYFSGGFHVGAAMLSVKRGFEYLKKVASKLGTSTALFSVAVSLSLNQWPTFAVPTESNLTIQHVDRAMLEKVRESWGKNGLDDLLINVLTSLDGMGQPYGLATTHTSDVIKYDLESSVQIKLKLHKQLAQLFGNDEKIGHLVIDGELEPVNNPYGGYVVRAASLDNVENLITGKATGTSIEIYKKNRDSLEIITSIRIQWGSDVRLLIATEDGAFDFKLKKDGELEAIALNGIRMKNQGTYISLGGETAKWPVAMKAFYKERLSQIPGLKERHSDSNAVDMYYMMSKGGLMTGWVSLSEAYGIAQFMSKANGLAKIQTENGLIDIKDKTMNFEDLESNRLFYIYAGVENLVSAAEGFINGRLDKGNGVSQIKEGGLQKDNSVNVRESLKEYIEHLIIPAIPGVEESVRDRIQHRIRGLISKIDDTFLNDLPLRYLEDHSRGGSRSSQIIEDLRSKLNEEERLIFFKKDGESYIHSLNWISDNLSKPARNVGEQNSSGDNQKVLDFIFNQILVYVMRLEVHAIISEEMAQVEYGSGESAYSTDAPVRIVNFLDPVDGTSQLSEGGGYGSIFTFGYLMQGQSIEKGNFDPRKQILISLEISFGPKTYITISNPSNEMRKPEVIQFMLTKMGDRLGFVQDQKYHNVLDDEINNLQWVGLVPKADKNEVLLLARGGSLQDATVLGHRQFAQWLEDRYSVRSIYSGALASEMKHVLLAQDISGQRIAGAMYFYPAKKLRQFFEGDAYSFSTSLVGAETIDGQQPMLNLPFVPQDGQSLSANSMPFYSGSTWMTKLMMSWSFYIQEYSKNKGGVKLTEKELNVEWNKFLKFYIQVTSRLIIDIARITQRPKKEVRRALLSWDSIDMGRNYFPRLLTESGDDIAKKLHLSAAMITSPIAAKHNAALLAVGHRRESHVEGGIDLNTSNMAMTVRRQGAGVKMAVDAALLARIRKDGIQSLTPVIDKITPISSIWSAVGMQAP